jgi:hypothetical protein
MITGDHDLHPTRWDIPDPLECPKCPISSYGQGFLDTECEKSFICRHNSRFNAGAVENATCICVHFTAATR